VVAPYSTVLSAPDKKTVATLRTQITRTTEAFASSDPLAALSAGAGAPDNHRQETST
jgi:hypothetical protein